MKIIKSQVSIRTNSAQWAVSTLRLMDQKTLPTSNLLTFTQYSIFPYWVSFIENSICGCVSNTVVLQMDSEHFSRYSMFQFAQFSIYCFSTEFRVQWNKFFFTPFLSFENDFILFFFHFSPSTHSPFRNAPLSSQCVHVNINKHTSIFPSRKSIFFLFWFFVWRLNLGLSLCK